MRKAALCLWEPRQLTSRHNEPFRTDMKKEKKDRTVFLLLRNELVRFLSPFLGSSQPTNNFFPNLSPWKIGSEANINFGRYLLFSSGGAKGGGCNNKKDGGRGNGCIGKKSL